MPEGKRARPEGTKYPMAVLLPEAIFNYDLTVEEYVFAFSEGNMLENCEKAGKGFLFSFVRSNISIFIHAL